LTLGIVGLGLLLAFANGANDVSKGVATLVGSGVTDLERAVRWGALATTAGAVLAVLTGGAMLDAFGKGLLADGTVVTFPAAAGVLVGATAWVLIATRAGLPVSTTHAIVGAIAGVGAVAYGPAGVRWDALAWKLGFPLLIAPVLSMAAVAALLSVRVGATDDRLHWLTSAATGVARGMNDAPKIAAIALAAARTTGAEPPAALIVGLVAAAMGLGSIAGGRRVTRVLAERITALDHRQGFVANLVTAALVAAGAVSGWPLSTTHVATGGIIGAGLAEGKPVDRGVVRGLLLAWVVTVPGAAGLGIAAWAALRAVS
jgi:PiT family inorganic phosphate transporter